MFYGLTLSLYKESKKITWKYFFPFKSFCWQFQDLKNTSTQIYINTCSCYFCATGASTVHHVACTSLSISALFSTATVCEFMCVLSLWSSETGWHLVCDENKMDENSRGWTASMVAPNMCSYPFIFFCRFISLLSFVCSCVPLTPFKHNHVCVLLWDFSFYSGVLHLVCPPVSVCVI